MNYDTAKTQEIANIFGCTIGKLPFTYVGLLLGTIRPTVTELMPLVCSLERRLSATLNMISYGGKLSLLNSVITSLIIFALCTLRLPTKIIVKQDPVKKFRSAMAKILLLRNKVVPFLPFVLSSVSPSNFCCSMVSQIVAYQCFFGHILYFVTKDTDMPNWI